MNDTTLKMVVAGILFGAWPLLMNRSGLNPVTSTAVFATVIFLIVVPVGYGSGMTLLDSKWWYAIIAGIVGALGLLVFNSGLSKATPENVGKLFVVMILVQTAVSALYHVLVNGELTPKTAAGFLAAVIAAILLT